MSPLRAALAYAAAGFPVFPCRATSDKAKGSKAPHLPGESAAGKHDGGHWLASTDAATIEAWWGRWPDALIGFPTGLRSGVVVVDLDVKEATWEAMLAALKSFVGGDLSGVAAATGEFILPAVAATQSGGLHLYYAYPPEAALASLRARLATRGDAFDGVPNRTNMFRAFVDAGAAAALSHIDVRGQGGYVIAPPSRMESGSAWTWIERPPRGDDGRWALPQLPQILLETIVYLRQPAAAAPARRFAPRASAIDDERVRRYVERSVAGALEVARHAQPGNRNAAVYWAACRLGQFVRGGALPRAAAEAALIANLPAGVSPGEAKILGTIRGGLDNDKSPPFSAQEMERAA